MRQIRIISIADTFIWHERKSGEYFGKKHLFGLVVKGLLIP